jgi:hypothetical protein
VEQERDDVDHRRPAAGAIQLLGQVLGENRAL